MILSAALAAFVFASSPSQAEDAAVPPPLSEMAPSRATPGWARQGSSLLLYGEDGGLIQELPLHSPEDSGVNSRETIGGASPDARLAWTLDLNLVWTPGRTKLLESRRTFKAYGTAGQELWRDDSVDRPERGEPVQFAADGKTLLLSRRVDAGWVAEARTWMGQPVASIGPFPRLISMALTSNGRYALARWGVPDKSDTHTFLDLATKARKDIPSSDLVLGLARVDDSGAVRSGSKLVYDFSVALSTAAAPPATSTAAAASTAPPAAK